MPLPFLSRVTASAVAPDLATHLRQAQEARAQLAQALRASFLAAEDAGDPRKDQIEQLELGVAALGSDLATVAGGPAHE